MPAPRSQEVYEEIAFLLRAMAEPMRLRLLEELLEGPRQVGDLVEALEQSHSWVSKQLKLLYEADLVLRRRQSTQVWYRLKDDLAEEICRLVCQGRKLEPQKKPQQALLFDL